MNTRFAGFAIAAALTASTAFAGNMEEPMMEEEPVMAEEIVVAESGSSGGFIVPLMLLALVAAVAAD